jgi:hypothetical protein
MIYQAWKQRYLLAGGHKNGKLVFEAKCLGILLTDLECSYAYIKVVIFCYLNSSNMISSVSSAWVFRWLVTSILTKFLHFLVCCVVVSVWAQKWKSCNSSHQNNIQENSIICHAWPQCGLCMSRVGPLQVDSKNNRKGWLHSLR